MSKRELRRQRRAEKKALKLARRGGQNRIQYMRRNFRLSLTFRIALSYCWQLARTALLAIAVMTLIFAGTVLDNILYGKSPTEF